LKYSH